MDILNDLEVDNILEKVFEYIKSKFTEVEKVEKDKKNFTLDLGITRIDYQKDIEGKEIILIIFILLILYLFKNIF